MTDASRIQKINIKASGINFDIFVKPNGVRKMSLTTLTAAIGKSHKSAGQILSGKSPEALAYKEKSAGQIEKIDGFERVRYGKYKTLVTLVPTEFTGLYLTYWATRGNKEAIALVAALAQESIDRRIDAVLGEQKTEEQYESQTTKLRLDLIDRLAGNFDLGGKSEFYGQLTEQEQQIGLCKVNIQRYEDLLADEDQWLMAPKYREQLEETRALLESLLAHVAQ